MLHHAYFWLSPFWASPLVCGRLLSFQRRHAETGVTRKAVYLRMKARGGRRPLHCSKISSPKATRIAKRFRATNAAPPALPRAEPTWPRRSPVLLLVHADRRSGGGGFFADVASRSMVEAAASSSSCLCFADTVATLLSTCAVQKESRMREAPVWSCGRKYKKQADHAAFGPRNKKS